MKIEIKQADPSTPAEGIERIAKAFEEFKSSNDDRLKQLEKRGEDAVTFEKVENLNGEITRLSDLVKDLEKRQARPLIGPNGKEISADQANYRKSFDLWARTGAGESEIKSLSGTVGADGGFTVPEVIDTQIEEFVIDISPVRSVANVISISTTDYKRIVNRRGTDSGWVGETDARPDTNTPLLAEVVPTMGDLYASPMATANILDDSMFDMETWLAGEIATEFARAEGAAFISGNGVNKPTGFLAGTPVATADSGRAFGVLQYTPSGAASALPTNFDSYTDMVTTLKAAYRTGAVWMAGKLTYANIRKIKASDGQYLWQPSLQVGMPDSVLGYPAIEAEDMPAIAANAFPIAFGNFNRGYLIVDRKGTTMLRDPYTNKPYIKFYTVKRVGGKILNSEAIKLMKVATT